ncbi:MAG TPA: hypothetical protein VGT40_22230 [Methylomirabilota bacterium]|nr:hypothetical protein [Methylomirabilota bacterium]
MREARHFLAMVWHPWLTVLVAVLSLTPGLARADVELPPRFSAKVYVTGDGFDASSERRARGIPSTSTMAFDRTGALYLGRTGRRYVAAEAEDLWPVYRIPAGGAHLTPKTEARYFHGPPLLNAQVAGARDTRELFITTFDRDRKIGVLYRMVDGRAALFAGGTPERGAPPLLKQPEGIAIDAGGFYVADRDRGVIVRLDATGRVLNPRYVAVTRPRVLALEDSGWLWIGSDGGAEAPWQQGPGELWRVSPEGVAQVVLQGPVAQAIALSPGGHLVVADRQAAQLYAVTPEGMRIELARFTDGDLPRSLAFAPVSDETRRAGIAGDLFVVIIQRAAWPVNEILHISGPVDELIRERRARSP